MVRLTQDANRQVKGYSLGMKLATRNFFYTSDHLFLSFFINQLRIN
ncbi:hypothetical protein [Kroppenstedtia pulmonis]